MISANTAALRSWISTQLKPFPSIWPPQSQPASNNDYTLHVRSCWQKAKTKGLQIQTKINVFFSYTYPERVGRGCFVFKNESSTLLVSKHYIKFKNTSKKKKRGKKHLSIGLALGFETRICLFWCKRHRVFWPCTVQEGGKTLHTTSALLVWKARNWSLCKENTIHCCSTWLLENTEKGWFVLLTHYPLKHKLFTVAFLSSTYRHLIFDL